MSEIQRGSEVRNSEYPIDRLFLDRWSPRAMSGEPIGESELLTLFEAAHWAPSSGNSQPWRFLYARRDTEHWPLFFELLNENNKTWCHRAAALIVFISRTTSDTGRVLRTHSYDTGSAWMTLAYQAWMKGLIAHGMAGFDYDRAKATLNVPDDFTVEAMAAVGKPGPKEDLPPQHLSRELPGQRKPVSDLVFAGPYRT
ncbi:MAG TPA: nitroreductase family protein [Vicinamibacterales bacterium]|jgi:nitroreductase|nr:nitroreductase family protein [Vicinamibacterales bacterium]